MQNKKNSLFLYIFFVITFFSFITLFFGDKYKFYFHQDMIDSFMDLFNSIVGNREWKKEIGIYPPLAILPYRILARLVPWDMFSPFLQGRELAFALRSSVPGAIILLLHLVCFIVPFIFICDKFLADRKNSKYLYISCFILSGIMLSSLERGNIIIYAFLFTLLFVLTNQSSQEKYIHLSYLCLAIAANLKFYPAVFGIILLGKKDYRGCFIVVIEFIVIYVFSFILCGLSFQTNNFTQINKWTSSITTTAIGLNYSFKNFILCSQKIFSSIVNINLNIMPEKLFMVFKLFILIIGIIAYFFLNTKWKKVAIPSILCILIPDVSFHYVLLFLFIPLIVFLTENSSLKLDYYYSVVFALIFSILIIPIKIDAPTYFISLGFVLQICLIEILFLSLVLESFIGEIIKK